MKVTELIYNARDSIMLQQSLDYVAVTNVTDISLLSLSLFYCLVKRHFFTCLSKFDSNDGKSQNISILGLIQSY